MNEKILNLKDIDTNTSIKNPILPKGFIVRIIAFIEKLAEVHSRSLEETVFNFQKDIHPERELEIWEDIAKVYETYTTKNPILTLKEKGDVYTIALGITMGTTEFNNIKKLTQKQAQEIVNLFNF